MLPLTFKNIVLFVGNHGELINPESYNEASGGHWGLVEVDSEEESSDDGEDCRKLFDKCFEGKVQGSPPPPPLVIKPE